VRGGNPFTAAELSGDATTSGSNVVTVAKINGNTVPSGAVAHQAIIATGANAFSLKTINDCTGGASALSFAQSGDAIGCLTFDSHRNIDQHARAIRKRNECSD
jgi:hypothetical protein